MALIVSSLVSTFVLSFALTLIAERTARRAGIVMRPAADRWHGETMALLDGVAIVIASVGPIFVTGPGRRLAVLAVAALARGSAGAHRRPADAEAAEQNPGGDRPGHGAHPVRFRAPPDRFSYPR